MQHDNDGEHGLVPETTRRDFLKKTGAVAAGVTLAQFAMPRAFAQEDNTIRLALVGSGGRGTGAVANAFAAPGGPIELYAIADIFEDRLRSSIDGLTNQFEDQINTKGREFMGFDAYKQAIDCLRPGDVVMLAALCYCRAAHVEYAVEKGVNVFMEKPFSPDTVGLRRILAAGKAAEDKNLKIGAGLMCRHSASRQAMIEQVRDGRLGDVQYVRAYRMSDGSRIGPRDAGEPEIEYQIRRKHDFFWVSSGRMIDYMIHQIDEACWIFDSWPIAAHGLGGREASNDSCGENPDTYAMEFTFEDGRKAFVNHRDISGCYNDFATYIHGTECAGQFSGSGHQATVRTFKGQNIDPTEITWEPEGEARNPWQAEWDVLIDAIRNDTPHNETERAVQADVTAIMGRAAIHTGRIVTRDEVFNSEFQFFPEVDAVTYDSPSPIKADADGNYPVPVPGMWQGL